MTNLAQLLVEASERHADEPAIKLDDTELSYAGLSAAAGLVGGLLEARGVGPGDRVGLMLPNVPFFPAVYYGALRVGATVVPMNVLLKAREVAFYLSDSGATVLLAWHGFEEAARAGAEQAGAQCILVEPGAFEWLLGEQASVEEIAGRDEDDTAVILYTSGTTGTPKGAELTHGNLTRNARVAADLYEVRRRRVILGALPLFHSFGQTCAMNASIVKGGCLTLIPRFDGGQALRIIERDRVNVFEGVPTMFAAMLHDEHAEQTDTSSLEICVSGGSAMPLEIMRAFEERFDCKILEGYGLSETSPVASFNPFHGERKPGSIGLPVDGVQMRVLDDEGRELPPGEVGEIAIRGHNVMKGYWKRPDATAEVLDEDGWLRTGDMARRDEDGYFFIVDRKKDLIIRGGYNVYPREIEEVLYEHPSVLEAAVVGVPDDHLGEEVGAAVALKPGQEVSVEELRDYVREQVAAYKYPRRVWLVDELPKGPTGKVLKREIALPGS